MKCPVCGCQRFYIRDPEDEYEVYCFDCATGAPVFDPEVSETRDIKDGTEIHCDQCTWHEKLDGLA